MTTVCNFLSYIPPPLFCFTMLFLISLGLYFISEWAKPFNLMGVLPSRAFHGVTVDTLTLWIKLLPLIRYKSVLVSSNNKRQLTFADSWDVRVATFSWDATSSLRSLWICCAIKKSNELNDPLQWRFRYKTASTVTRGKSVTSPSRGRTLAVLQLPNATYQERNAFLTLILGPRSAHQTSVLTLLISPEGLTK